MAKKRLTVALVVYRGPVSDLEINGLVGVNSKVGYQCVLSTYIDYPVLCLWDGSAILVAPELGEKVRKRVKKCCDKKCSKCGIPMISGETRGYFINRRISKALKKASFARNFFSHRVKVVEEALEGLSIRCSICKDGLASLGAHSSQELASAL